MGLLQHEKVHYYHPMDDSTESLQNLAWSLGDDGSFVPGGKVGGGLQVGDGTGTTLGRATYNPATPSYPGGFDGETAVAMAFWVENYFTAGGSKSIFLGYGGADSGTGWSTGSNIYINKQGSLYDVMWNPNGQFSGSNRFITSPPADGAGWHFVVVDLRTEQPSGQWRIRTSFDGAGWTDEGLANTTTVASGTHARTLRAAHQAEHRRSSNYHRRSGRLVGPRPVRKRGTGEPVRPRRDVRRGARPVRRALRRADMLAGHRRDAGRDGVA